MKEIIGILISLIGLAMQSSFSDFFGFQGIKPDIVLMVVVFYAFFYGYKKSAFFGLILGLIEDLFIGEFIGMNLFIKMATGIIVGLFSRNIYRDSKLLPIIIVFVSTIIANYFKWAFMNIFIENIEINYFIRVAFVQAMLNIFAVPFFYIHMYFRRKK